MRPTPQRTAIRDALEAAGRPLSPQEIHDLARADVPRLGTATVYRVLRELEAAGEIVPVAVPGEADRWELAAAAARHHHHFHCDDCDRVFDMPGCVGGVEDLAPEGFEVRGHQIMLEGRCPECRPDAGDGPDDAR